MNLIIRAALDASDASTAESAGCRKLLPDAVSTPTATALSVCNCIAYIHPTLLIASIFHSVSFPPNLVEVPRVKRGSCPHLGQTAPVGGQAFPGGSSSPHSCAVLKTRLRSCTYVATLLAFCFSFFFYSIFFVSGYVC